MIVFPNCKINLGLNIVHKREDNFHNLETVFYPLPFTDALEVVTNTSNHTESVLNISGISIDGNLSDNLCTKAYRLLKKDFPDLPAVKIHLHKAIPAGAGLGGGSANAAFMLKLLNDKFKLNLSARQLISYSLTLGSDCPFFIINKPCFATGRGEKLSEITVALSDYKIILINPGIHINTGWAFSQVTPAVPIKSINEIVKQDISSWKEELKNDFEELVFAAHPQVRAIKEYLYTQGAIYASMSGSGSTVFGIFDKNAVVNAGLNDDYFYKVLN